MLVKEVSDNLIARKDCFSPFGVTVASERGNKKGKELQKPMKDTEGVKNCIFCHPELIYTQRSRLSVIIPDRVACMPNQYPFLNQHYLVFQWHSDAEKREQFLHLYQLEKFRKMQLFWLLKGCVELGKNKLLSQSNSDYQTRFITGLNLGKLAGQSVPHFHAQCGFEISSEENIENSNNELKLYINKLADYNLIIYQNKSLNLIAPWSPKGSFALDLCWTDKFHIHEMNEDDLKIAAVFGEQIINQYIKLGFQNLNIFFSNSPIGLNSQPLTLHFVPRANISAFYELLGNLVVDSGPEKTMELFGGAIDWNKIYEYIELFDPDN